MVLSTTNELELLELMNTQNFLKNFDDDCKDSDSATTTWSALKIPQQLQVLTVLAAYFELVQQSTNPDAALFIANFKKAKKSVAFRDWMVAPDVQELASSPSNAEAWRRIGKASGAQIALLQSYMALPSDEQQAELLLNGVQIKSIALGMLRSVPV